jgi:hypothetical protein
MHRVGGKENANFAGPGAWVFSAGKYAIHRSNTIRNTRLPQTKCGRLDGSVGKRRERVVPSGLFVNRPSGAHQQSVEAEGLAASMESGILS